MAPFAGPVAGEGHQHTPGRIGPSGVRPARRAAIPAMREGGGGSIVNLASLTAKQPIDGIALSNALRPALVGMAKTLSREAAPEVRVNNIATEHILTDRIRDIAERIGARATSQWTTPSGGWR